MNTLNAVLIFVLTCCFNLIGLTAQNVSIPDANFKTYLVGNALINTNGDTEIQVNEAVAFAGEINCSSLIIADLTGIEAFVNLTILNCHSNLLTTLDLSQNNSLITLFCYQNQLSSLDVSQKPNLVNLACNYNQLTTLDISQNSSLTYLDCHHNQLTTLDISQSPSLVTLGCYYNLLTTVDLSQNTSLINLYCYYNLISSINLSQNASLETISCYENQLTSLDLSQNTNLTTLYCNNNLLNNLDVSQNASLVTLNCYYNQLLYLDVRNGNNTNMGYFNAASNPALICIEVDDSTYSTTNWTSIDPLVSFSRNCYPVFNSISKIGKIEDITAYPNPTAKSLTLDFGQHYQIANIQVSNLRGQVVLSKTIENSSSARLELEEAAGIYFVSIQTEVGASNLKVIKE